MKRNMRWSDEELQRLKRRVEELKRGPVPLSETAAFKFLVGEFPGRTYAAIMNAYQTHIQPSKRAKVDVVSGLPWSQEDNIRLVRRIEELKSARPCDSYATIINDIMSEFPGRSNYTMERRFRQLRMQGVGQTPVSISASGQTDDRSESYNVRDTLVAESITQLARGQAEVMPIAKIAPQIIDLDPPTMKILVVMRSQGDKSRFAELPPGKIIDVECDINYASMLKILSEVFGDLQVILKQELKYNVGYIIYVDNDGDRIEIKDESQWLGVRDTLRKKVHKFIIEEGKNML